MRFRFTIAGMLWFSVLIGLLCTLGTLGYKLAHLQFANRLAASADGRLLVVGRHSADLVAGQGGGDVNVWDTASGRLLQTLATRASFFTLATVVSPDGQRIVICDGVSRLCELWVRDGSQFRLQKVPDVLGDGAVIAVSQDCRWQVTHNLMKNTFGIWSLDDASKHATCAETAAGANRGSCVGLDEGSGRLVAGYADGHVDVFEATSGQLQKTIITGHMSGSTPSEMELSPDGRWAAFSVWDSTTNPSTETCWVSVIDLDAGKEVLRNMVHAVIRPAAFSSDSHTVALVEGSVRSLHLYDLPSGFLRGDLGGPDVTGVVGMGPDRWALMTGLGVELWKQHPGGLEAYVLRDRTADGFGWVTLGLLGWLVVSLVIHFRRNRIPCSVCGQVRLLAWRRPKPICTFCAQQTRRWRQWNRGLATAGVIIGLIPVISLINDWAANREFDWLTPVAPIAMVTVATAAYVVLFIAWFYWRARRLNSERYDFKRAGRAAGTRGIVRRSRPLTVWSPVESDWLQHAHEWVSAAGQNFAQLTGLDVDCRRPLRLLVFERWREFDQYLKLYNCNCWPWPSVELPGNKLVTSIEGMRGALVEPERWLRVMSSSWFRQDYPALRTASWLTFGNLLAHDEWAETRLLRKMKLLLASDPQAGAGMFDSRVLMQMVRTRLWYVTDDYMRLLWQILPRMSFTAYLAGPEQDLGRRSLFRETIGDLAGGADWSQVAERRYQCKPERLIERWREWIQGRTPGNYERPEPWQRQIIADELLPIAHDRSQPTIARLRVVRGLADAGFTLVAPDMLELMSDADPLVRADAAQALKLISGCDHGDDLRAWRAWCDSLPSDEPAVAAENG